jgi:hypothetical protein
MSSLCSSAFIQAVIQLLPRALIISGVNVAVASRFNSDIAFEDLVYILSFTELPKRKVTDWTEIMWTGRPRTQRFSGITPYSETGCPAIATQRLRNVGVSGIAG